MKEMISKLANRETLSHDEAYAALSTIMNGDATDAQIAAFITALRMVGETPDIIAGAAKAMQEAFTPVKTSQVDAVDTCGTGGDGAHTFNISTTCAFVTAGAGVPVAKHGNRSVSSKCGSADVLKELGVDITASPEVMSKCLDQIGIAFLFAPSLHPAMKHAIGPRREIGIRTIFNILGPLSNPASVKRGVLGVYDPALVPMIAEAACSMGAEHLFVVHGKDGLDEITSTAETVVGEVHGGGVNTYEVKPEDFDLVRSSPDDLKGGEPAENAEITRAILNGEKGPKRDIVLLNAAAAITAGGKANNLAEGVIAAAESIDGGLALNKLNQLAELTASGAA